MRFPIAFSLLLVLAAAPVSAESLYALQDDTLYSASADDGSWNALSATWEGANALRSNDSCLFGAQGGYIY
ncbi:MAG: hypothetical protein ACJAYU_002199 [Bradymonadia bacterium]|jgi:hypothetical protein